MFNLKDKEQEALYTSLMNNIKNINSEWISINNSREYKIGKSILEIKNDLKKFKIKNIYKSLSRKYKGKKMRKVNSSNMSFESNDKKYNPNYFSNKKIAIYTSIFGGYDQIFEPLYVPNNCDFYVITDLEIEKNSKWKKIDILPEMKNMSNVEKNRYVKMNPHLVFKEYDYSIYVDGNIQIVSDLTEYVNLLNKYGIAIHKHNRRNCIFDELEAIEKSKKDTKENILKHKKYLLESNMPKNYGLLQCSIIVREHNNPICIKIMEEWWNEFENYSKRDQISLPHVLYMNNIKVNDIGILGGNIYKNPSFRIYNHN